jgi:glutaredoxin
MKLCLIVVLIASVSAAHGADTPTQTTLYKSVGQDGRTVYGDRLPVDGRTAQTMRFENLPSSPLSPATLAYLEQLKKGSGTSHAALPNGELILFTTSWCTYCKKAKAYLASKGATYKEVDIESDAGTASYVQAGGQRGVPLLFKSGQRVLGFTSSAYDALLSGKN